MPHNVVPACGSMFIRLLFRVSSAAESRYRLIIRHAHGFISIVVESLAQHVQPYG